MKNIVFVGFGMMVVLCNGGQSLHAAKPKPTVRLVQHDAMLAPKKPTSQRDIFERKADTIEQRERDIFEVRPDSVEKRESSPEATDRIDSPVGVTDRLPATFGEFAPRTEQYRPQTDSLYRGKEAFERVDQLRAKKDAVVMRENFLAERAGRTKPTEAPAVQEAVVSALPASIGQRRPTPPTVRPATPVSAAFSRTAIRTGDYQTLIPETRLKNIDTVEQKRAKKNAKILRENYLLEKQLPDHQQYLEILFNKQHTVENRRQVIPGTRRTSRERHYDTVIKPLIPEHLQAAFERRAGLKPLSAEQ